MKEGERISGNETATGRVLVAGVEKGDALTVQLERMGLQVVSADSGLEALVSAIQSVQRGYFYDLVIINMQASTLGQLTALSIRKLKEYRNVPILAVSLSSVKGSYPGINEVIVSPADAAAIAKIGYWLGPGKDDAAKGMEGLELDNVHMLEGIDLQTGLSHMAGNWRLYRDLLLKFSDSHARFADQLVEKLKGGGLSDSGRMIHTLKGLSGSLGMIRLRLLSQQLEEIIRHGVMGDPSSLVQPLSNELNTVLASIHANLKASDSTRTAQPMGKAISKLNELEKALNDHNPDAAQRVDEIGNIMGYESEMARLKKAVSAYEFEMALVVLREIKSSPKVGSVQRID